MLRHRPSALSQSPSPSAARCSAAGSGLKGAVAGNWMRFYIEARDEFDNVITTGDLGIFNVYVKAGGVL